MDDFSGIFVKAIWSHLLDFWWLWLFILSVYILKEFRLSNSVNINKNFNKNSERCPRCNGYLVERNGKYGKFFGCSNFPKCRFIKNTK